MTSSWPGCRAVRTTAALFVLSFMLASRSEAAGIREGYPSSTELEARLRAAAASIPGASVIEYGKSLQGKPLLALQITRGPGNPLDRPAILVAAGLEPTRLHAAEMALAVATNAGAVPRGSADPLMKSVLYVIADANPDGRTRVLAGAADDRNARAWDDDRDGSSDEDRPDDMDGDHAIRFLRVYRTGGLYRPDSADARANVTADAARGEVGVFDLLPEGRDQDRDGDVNEDGEGGVNLNVNFPQDYRMFTPESGPYAVSEPESQALADFVIAHPNIGAALVFASDDVLTEAPRAAEDDRKPQPAPSGRFAAAMAGIDPAIQALLRDSSPVKGILKGDIAPYERAAALYSRDVAVKKDASAVRPQGSFGDWLRYHQGLFALVTPGWTWADSAARGDSSGTGSGGDRRPRGPGGNGRRGGGGMGGPGGWGGPGGGSDAAPKPPDEAKVLRSLERKGVTAFKTWTVIDDPDFPGRKVEVGGLDPLVLRTPPHGEVDSLAARHARFVSKLLAWSPELTMDDPIVEKLSPGVYRVRTEIANVGYLPTALNQGIRSRKARPVRLDLELPEKAVLLEGQKVTLVHTLAGGGGHRELEWVIQAQPGSSITLKAGAPRAGSVQREVKLP